MTHSTFVSIKSSINFELLLSIKLAFLRSSSFLIFYLSFFAPEATSKRHCFYTSTSKLRLKAKDSLAAKAKAHNFLLRYKLIRNSLYL